MRDDKDESIGTTSTIALTIAFIASLIVGLIEPLIYVIGAVALVAILCKLTNC
jgi:hypothetical protein